MHKSGAIKLGKRLGLRAVGFGVWYNSMWRWFYGSVLGSGFWVLGSGFLLLFLGQNLNFQQYSSKSRVNTV